MEEFRMSNYETSYFPVGMYGVQLQELKLKPEYVHNDENSDSSIKPKYNSFYDFVTCEHIEDEVVSWVCESETECCVGICASATYPWKASKALLALKTEDDAKEYIAERLLPYCNSTRHEIKKACYEIWDAEPDTGY